MEDKVSELPAFSQTTSVTWVNTLSSLLSTVRFKDVSDQLRGRKNMVKVLCYADDLVIYGSSRFHVQQVLIRLHSGLIKAEAMKFRTRGRFAVCFLSMHLYLSDRPLPYVNRFTYL